MSYPMFLSATCATVALLLGTAAQAQTVLTNADGIVRNSLCVGFDCQAAITFSDSSIILKENNTRIKFADTSLPPFPDNDWEIEANSASSGIPGYLGFNDCGAAANDGGCQDRLVFAIEAGARANALYVTSLGRVGFGTATPVVDLHMKSGNTPTLRLEQDTSNGFSPQTWDLAGNETNFFLRDVTNGSRLSFRVRPNAPTSSIDIAQDGDVFMGLQANNINSGDLVVGGAGNKFFDLASTDNAAAQVRLISNGANRRIVAKDDDAAVPDAQIQFSNNTIVMIRDANTQMATFSNTGLAVTGALTTTGGGACTGVPCDAVFDPAVYTVPSIEDHAALMWDNKYLPAVGPTDADTPINVTDKMTRMLNELEHAHIYIEQLNARIKAQDDRIEGLVQRMSAL